MYSGLTGTLDLGSVVISRGGLPKEIKAATFSMGCLVDTDIAVTPSDVYSDHKFVVERNDKCVMDSRFGAGQAVVVKSHLEDSLMSVVRGNISVALDDDIDDPLATAKVITLAAANTPDNTMVWVYEVDKDAMLGDHTITVSTTAKDEDDKAIANDPLTVSVAGPPTQYMFVDPVDNIELGGRATFTVQAYDTNDGVPYFAKNNEDMYTDDKVEVVVPDIAESLVRGSNLANGALTLDKDTGMGTFTIYAPSNAAGGSTARIFVSAGDVEITHTVTFGAATPGEGEMVELMMPTGVTLRSFPGSGSINVSWTAGQGAEGHVVLLFTAAAAYVDIEYVTDIDTASHTFRGVATGDYYVVVASYQGSMYEYDFLGTDVTVR